MARGSAVIFQIDGPFGVALSILACSGFLGGLYLELGIDRGSNANLTRERRRSNIIPGWFLRFFLSRMVIFYYVGISYS